MTPKTPAGRLVAAFGKPAEMVELLAPQVEWSLPRSLPFPRPVKGKQAVFAMMTDFWTVHYSPDVTVQFLDELGDERLSAARYDYRTFSLSNQQDYENEYTLFARSGPEGITEVFEMFDTKRTLDFFYPERKIEFKG